MNSRKFIFFGTPYVARDTLAKLLEGGFTPAIVVTNPDAPRGRGYVMTPSETKALALERGIEVFTPDKLDESAIAHIKTFGGDYAVVVAYGKIFPQSLIDAFPLGAINVHYSLLPKYRGASPVESALLNGEKVTGVTVQQMAFAMDAGDILAQEEVAIGENETSKELKPRLIEAGAALLVDLLPAFEKGEITPLPQDHTQATRAGKIKKEDGLLDLTVPAVENWNKYRAYAEWPGVYFFEGEKRIKVTKARYENDAFVIERVVPEGKPETDYIPGARAPK